MKSFVEYLTHEHPDFVVDGGIKNLVSENDLMGNQYVYADTLPASEWALILMKRTTRFIYKYFNKTKLQRKMNKWLVDKLTAHMMNIENKLEALGKTPLSLNQVSNIVHDEIGPAKHRQDQTEDIFDSIIDSMAISN